VATLARVPTLPAEATLCAVAAVPAVATLCLVDTLPASAAPALGRVGDDASLIDLKDINRRSARTVRRRLRRATDRLELILGVVSRQVAGGHVLARLAAPWA
jgi:hypothetical protein